MTATSSTGATETIIDIMTGTWRAQAVHAAVGLGLPDLVADGYTTAADLASRAEADPDSIIRLMRLLIGMRIFDGDDATGYRLTPLSELLCAATPGSVRDLCLLYGAEVHQAWGAVLAATCTGRSGFELAFGHTLHEHLASDAAAAEGFLCAMNAGNLFFDDVVRNFDFTSRKTVVDLAGGSGLLLRTVLENNPDVRGTLFDLKHMLPIAERQLGPSVPGRYELVAGDLFRSVPRGADVYMLSRILQDWPDDRCVTLLSNVRSAMTDPRTRLLIVDRVIGAGEPALLPLLYDVHLQMMAGGQGRTLEDYRVVLADAGMRVESVHDLALQSTLLVVAPD